MSNYQSKCPKCKSTDFVDSVRLEQCNSCGYYFYYGDAYATGEDQLSSGSDYYRQRGDPVEE